jgi:hypothetical protein
MAPAARERPGAGQNLRWPKCRACPLHDREWGAESGEPPWLVLPAFGPDAEELDLEVPDRPPRQDLRFPS